MGNIDHIIIPQVDCINHLAVTRFMSKKFAAYDQTTKKLLAAFESALSGRPDQVIDSVRGALSGTSPLLPLTAKLLPLVNSGLVSKGKSISPGLKIELLSCLWDCSDALAFPAQVLSMNKTKLIQRTHIWSHFACFGLTSQDRNHFRLIRNCCAHGIRIKDGYLIETSKHGEVKLDCNGLEKKVCSISDVEHIFEKADLVFSWWFTLILATAINSPRFAIILIRAAFEQLPDKSNNVGSIVEELYPSENAVVTSNRSHSRRMPSSNDVPSSKVKVSEILSRLVIELKNLAIDSRDDLRSYSFSRWAEIIDVLLKKVAPLQRPVEVASS